MKAVITSLALAGLALSAQAQDTSEQKPKVKVGVSSSKAASATESADKPKPVFFLIDSNALAGHIEKRLTGTNQAVAAPATAINPAPQASSAPAGRPSHKR